MMPEILQPLSLGMEDPILPVLRGDTGQVFDSQLGNVTAWQGSGI